MQRLSSGFQPKVWAEQGGTRFSAPRDNRLNCAVAVAGQWAATVFVGPVLVGYASAE